MKKIFFILVFIVSLNATEKMTVKELVQGVYSETKDKFTQAKTYVQYTHEENKAENENTAILETTKDVSKKSVDKLMDMTIKAAKEVKTHVQE